LVMAKFLLAQLSKLYVFALAKLTTQQFKSPHKYANSTEG
jgi:hypothetical protein